MADRLLSLRLRAEASSRVAVALAKAYDILYSAVHNPVNGYSEPGDIAYQTPDRIKLLLNVEAT